MTLTDLYVPDETLPRAWLFDVDGTLALRDDTVRGPYDETLVGTDRLHVAVAELARLIDAGGDAVVILSGRQESARIQTETWLTFLNVPFADLHMRRFRDQRPDDVVKAELFDVHVRRRWNVRGVVDDRNRVVALWRSIGLTCLQAQDGDF